MKSKLAVLVGALLLAGSAYAQTNQVLSVNAVGYVKVDLVASNKLHLLSNNFEPLSAPIAISNTFASLPVGTQIFLWDEAGQAYKPSIVKTAFGWGSGGTNRIVRGKSMFLRTANSATNTASYPVYLMGEVPDSATAPTTTATTVAGFQFLGNAYPVDTKWTNTAVAKAVPVGSSITTWNSASQSYSAQILKTAFGWGGAGNALVLNPGQGYLVKTTNTVVYADVKPYTWP